MKNTEKKTRKPAAKKNPAPKAAPKAESSVKTAAAAVKAKADVNPDLTDAFINEVSEEVKNDNFKALWNRYGLAIIAVVVIAVCGAVSFERIKSWRQQHNQIATETYMDSARKQDPEAMMAALQKINQNDHGIYGDFARLQIANLLIDQQKEDEGLAMLESLSKDTQVNSEVRQIALIKYATYKVDTMSKQELSDLLKPVLAAENSWTPLANDLLAMAAIREGDWQTARDIYSKLLTVKDLPESFKSKIQEMLSSLNNAGSGAE